MKRLVLIIAVTFNFTAMAEVVNPTIESFLGSYVGINGIIKKKSCLLEIREVPHPLSKKVIEMELTVEGVTFKNYKIPSNALKKEFKKMGRFFRSHTQYTALRPYIMYKPFLVFKFTNKGKIGRVSLTPFTPYQSGWNLRICRNLKKLP